MVNHLLKLEMLHCLDKKYFIWIILFLSSFSVYSQITSREDKDLFSEADKAFYVADYINAIKMYKLLLPKDTANNELNFKLGVCHFELKKFRKKSLGYFLKVNTNQFPEALYYLGLLSHSNKNFLDAIAYYNKYKAMGGRLDHEDKEVDDLIEKCYTARFYETSINRSVQIDNLGGNLNSEYPEYAPLIPADESFLLFTSRRKNAVFPQVDAYEDYYEDVYISQRTNGIWQPPVLMDTSINTSVHDAGAGLSANGEKLLLYRTSTDLMSGNIFESNLIDGKWSHPIMLGGNVNTADFLESSACYSKDNDLVVYSSNKPGGFGGLDLYMVRKLDNGNWGESFNLGPKINTEYNEDSPFIDPSGLILYFSSEGHKNMGGYDVFKTNFVEDGSFSEPDNLGSPINTVNDDIFFVMNTDGSTAYMSSQREDGFGMQDLYSVTFLDNTSNLKAYSIHLFDADSIIKNKNISIIVKEKRQIAGVFKSNFETGKVLILYNPEKKCDLFIEVNGYESIKIDDFVFGKENELKFSLKRAKQ